MSFLVVFFFNDTPTTEIYTLSLHDALPISLTVSGFAGVGTVAMNGSQIPNPPTDRKSTRLNSSHITISYAVFCLKKKKPTDAQPPMSPSLLLLVLHGGFVGRRQAFAGSTLV